MHRTEARCARARQSCPQAWRAQLSPRVLLRRASADWAKGHSRRGAAYVGKKNWKAAIAAYEKALECDPDSASVKADLAFVSGKLNKGFGDSMPNNPSAAGSRPSASAAPAAGFVGRLVPALNALILLTAFFYVIPLLGPRRAIPCYRVSVGCALVLYLSTLLARHPLKFATLRDPAVTGSHEAQLSFICFMLLVSPPLPFAIVPFGAYAVHSVASNYGSAVVPKLPGFIKGVLEPRLAFLLTEEGANMVQAFAAISELMVLLAAPLQLAVHGFRVVVLTGFYFQYVSRRYAASFWTKQAVVVISAKTHGFFHHAYCPSPIGMLYDKLVVLIGSLAARVR